MTPTTEDVRLIWIVSQTGCTARAEFDRWLNSIKAEAWEEGAKFGVRDQHDGYAGVSGWTKANPYRLAGKDE